MLPYHYLYNFYLLALTLNFTVATTLTLTCLSYIGIYSNGLLFAGMGKENSKDGDDLLCLFEDLAGRNTIPTAPAAATGSQSVVFPSQSPSLREGICVPCDPAGRPAISGKVHDIKESCMAIHNTEAATLLSLYSSSAVSLSGTDESPYNDLPQANFLVDPSECPPGPALVLAAAGVPPGRGIQRYLYFFPIFFPIFVIFF
jgi:hypothetical protein